MGFWGIPILPDMPNRLPLNLPVYLSLVLLEVEVLCKGFVAYLALKVKHSDCLWYFFNLLLLFNSHYFILIDNEFCDSFFLWSL